MRYICCALLILLPGRGHADYLDLPTRYSQLQEQIKAVDAELARCKKQQKNWKIATIIGGVGTVATGVGALAQQSAINENKKDLQMYQSISDEKSKDLAAAKEKLNKDKQIIQQNKEMLENDRQILETSNKFLEAMEQ
ncbi:MAG: hypothetical protein LBJ73_04565 [Rickettsiales bacterium]|jgi:hypothetical protein|nr:hypothetical protein [Rickettsiales bacterium]